MDHARWRLARERRRVVGDVELPEVAAVRMEIRVAFDFGQAVYDRRTASGVSQRESARRAEVKRAQIARLELGGTVPTPGLAARLAAALDAAVRVTLDGDASGVVLTPHAG
ncbi:multiprotein-bridging factor 1 family protein [Embleya sp. NPDC056575]|uniref:helix-turn-helix domain-containing protein n=1 Tax=unclassified Embleya TaxID=2699296 RepID=UPI0036B9BFF2